MSYSTSDTSGAFRVASATEGYDKGVEDLVAIQGFGAGVLLVVADGAGGSGCGRLAAEAVVDHARQCLAGARDAENPASWAQCLKEVDEALLKGGSGGETTAVVLTITDRGIAGASSGDSGAWLITEAGRVDLTRHQRRKPLIGSGEALPVAFADADFRGVLLMASDGLFKYAPPGRICEVALTTRLEDTPRRLIDLVRMPSGGLQDDVGLILAARK